MGKILAYYDGLLRHSPNDVFLYEPVHLAESVGMELNDLYREIRKMEANGYIALFVENGTQYIKYRGMV